MGELVRLPTIHKQQIAHLGTEHDPYSCVNAEKLLLAGHYVTMQGNGNSMHPIIPDGTRMVFGPWEKGRRPTKYDVLFCRAGNRGQYYTTHLCWYITRRKFLMIDTAGNVLGYIPFKYILGEYLGAWDENKRDIIPYTKPG
jgi:hypothetical protein